MSSRYSSLKNSPRRHPTKPSGRDSTRSGRRASSKNTAIPKWYSSAISSTKESSTPSTNGSSTSGTKDSSTPSTNGSFTSGTKDSSTSGRKDSSTPSPKDSSRKGLSSSSTRQAVAEFRQDGSLSSSAESPSKLNVHARPYTPPNSKQDLHFWSLKQIAVFLANSVGDPSTQFKFSIHPDLNYPYSVQTELYRCVVMGHFQPYLRNLFWSSPNRIYGAYLNRFGKLIFSVWSLSFREVLKKFVDRSDAPYQYSDLITFTHGSQEMDTIYHPRGFQLYPEINGEQYRDICEEFSAWFPTMRVVMKSDKGRQPYLSYQTF